MCVRSAAGGWGCVAKGCMCGPALHGMGGILLGESSVPAGGNMFPPTRLQTRGRRPPAKAQRPPAARACPFAYRICACVNTVLPTARFCRAAVCRCARWCAALPAATWLSVTCTAATCTWRRRPTRSWCSWRETNWWCCQRASCDECVSVCSGTRHAQ